MKSHCSLKRALVEDKLAAGKVVELNVKDKRDKVHHLVAVLRLKVGDSLRAFNATDGEWLAKVTDVSKKKVVMEIGERLREAEQTNPQADRVSFSSQITLAFGLIKHHRLAILIEKCTEIGAAGFVPLITDWTVAHDLRLNKLEAYVLQAVEQSERLSVPTIAEAVSFKKFLETNQSANIIALDPRSNVQPLLEVLAELAGTTSSNADKSSSHKPLILAIGPEGGFSEAELALAADQTNVRLASLGQNILRAETAAIVALAQVVCCNRKNFPIPSSS